MGYRILNTMGNVAKVQCPYCGSDAALADSSEIYGSSYGHIWICRPCDAYTGVHKSSPTFKPLGTLAKKELRVLRKAVHGKLDPIWQKKRMTRSQVYSWLASVMELRDSEAHVAKFDEIKCRKALYALNFEFYS